MNYGAVHAYTDEVSKQYAGANGSHRMKEALVVISLNALAAHRFGSIHMKKIVRKDIENSYLDRYITNDGYLKLGNYWFVTDKIGPNDQNFGIFETGPTNGTLKYNLFGCVRVGPQMYADYQSLLDSINFSKRLIYALVSYPVPVDYTINDLFNFVMSVQGYNLDKNKVAEGLYWESPGYTQVGDNEIIGRVEVNGRGIPIKIGLAVHQFSIRVDYNDDRKVTSEDDGFKGLNSFKFWVNSNKGYLEGVRDDGTNDIPNGESDCSDEKINGVRDLVDFAPVCFIMDVGLMKMLNENRQRFTLKASNLGGEGRINIFPAANQISGGDAGADGSYLTNQYIAGLAVNGASNVNFQNSLLSGSAPSRDFRYSTEKWFLMEGVQKGMDDFSVDIVDNQTDDVLKGDVIHLDLKGVEEFYCHMKTSNLEVQTEPEYGPEATRTRYKSIDYFRGKNFQDFKDGVPVIVFLHGFNVDLPASINWFDESSKRLYWSGYKGEMVCVTWNGAIGGKLAPLLFNDNIESSFKTGPACAMLLQQLTQNHRVTLMAHSAGNIAILESLKLNSILNKGVQVENLITMEAASFTSVYDDLIDIPFRNISHNNLFKSSLFGVANQKWNFYSADDKTLYASMVLNETGISPLGPKSAWFISTEQQRRELEAIPRTNSRVAYVIPGPRSYGPSDLGAPNGDIIPLLTRPLGNVAVSQVKSLNCEQIGFGIREGTRNALAGSHSFMRETNYHESYLLFRKIVEVAK